MITLESDPAHSWRISEFFIVEDDPDLWTLYGTVQVGNACVEIQKEVTSSGSLTDYWTAAAASVLGTSEQPNLRSEFPADMLTELLDDQLDLNPLTLALMVEELYGVARVLSRFLDAAAPLVVEARLNASPNERAFLLDHTDEELETFTRRIAAQL